MIHTLDDDQTIDVGLALRTIKEVCQSYAVCKGCPLISFCCVNLRLDPCVWCDADIPEQLIVTKNIFKERKIK